MAFTARDALRRHEQARAARCFLPGAQTIPQSWRYRELVKMFVRHQNRWLMLLSNNVSDSKRRDSVPSPVPHVLHWTKLRVTGRGDDTVLEPDITLS